METTELIIQTEHPPHPFTYIMGMGRYLHRNLPKVALFTALFVLSFHLPYLNSDIQQFPPGLSYFNAGLQDRERTIEEIRVVLDKRATGLPDDTKDKLAAAIYHEAVRYNQDPKFVLALISIESSFQNSSVSGRGAKGLMQIMPFVAESIAKEIGIKWNGDSTLLNPLLNVKMGLYYLSQLILDFKDPGLALQAYNYGPTYVKTLLGRKQRVPKDYYYKILTAQQNL